MPGKAKNHRSPQRKPSMPADRVRAAILTGVISGAIRALLAAVVEHLLPPS